MKVVLAGNDEGRLPNHIFIFRKDNETTLAGFVDF